MDIKNLVANTRATCGDKAILTGVKSVYRYVNGVREANPYGCSYTVVLPERRYDELVVTIEGEAQMENPENPVEVSFTGLELQVRWSKDKGNYVAGTAVGIAPVKRS